MATTFLPYLPEQSLLLPVSLAEWLPEDHLAYFISDAVDALDLDAFYARYAGDGRRRQPFEPRMMVKVLWRRISRIRRLTTGNGCRWWSKPRPTPAWRRK